LIKWAEAFAKSMKGPVKSRSAADVLEQSEQSGSDQGNLLNKRRFDRKTCRFYALEHCFWWGNSILKLNWAASLLVPISEFTRH
jgi:hypothetical protein